LVGKSEGKRPLGRPRHRWRVILKCVFKKWYGTWTGMMRLSIGTDGGPVVNAVMTFLVPLNVGKLLTN